MLITDGAPNNYKEIFNLYNKDKKHYIRTMSRPIGQNAGDLQVDDAMWSGVYRERLVGDRLNSNKFLPSRSQLYS
ncbi:unnamed protein product [Strongylus vulgaris]|uniref:Uncharacterized protein n=1 Tax=Strongylus vulgaris TaxID=40348 RepID=A0A3P7J1C6_STRVU|nr:unnamed protein product [Strongylus vulgaris]